MKKKANNEQLPTTTKRESAGKKRESDGAIGGQKDFYDCSFHQEAWLCLLVCANPFLRGVDGDEYNTSFSSSFVFVQNTV